MIKLNHITKTFQTPSLEVHACKDVTLDIGAGEIYGIIGFSGAGKSTLVRCINPVSYTHLDVYKRQAFSSAESSSAALAASRCLFLIT